MIVVHRFIAGQKARAKAGGKVKVVNIGMRRAMAHVKYIQHRPGLDDKEGGREFFDEEGEPVSGKEVRERLRELEEARVIAHALTLSPQINIEDKKALTLEVMAKFAQLKGQEFSWVAVEHNNTDNHHVHLVLFGKDKHGKAVVIKKADYKTLRELGDDHLERVYPFELSLYKDKKEREAKEKQQELDRQKEEKLRDAQEKREGVKRQKELERQRRIQEGLELPWLHQKIAREMYQPYKTWKAGEIQRVKDLEQKRLHLAARRATLDKIEAAGKDWTKEDSLKELQNLNQYLWDNFDERIDGKAYKKLVSWIKEKEAAERGELLAGKREEQSSGPGEQKEKPDFEYGGKKYSGESSEGVLRELSKKVHAKGAKRLPIEDYQKLRTWVEDKDRSKWQGILSKEIERAKERHSAREYAKLSPSQGRAAAGTPGPGAATAFGLIAAAGEVASFTVMAFFDFSDGSPGPNRDRRWLEPIYQPDMQRPIPDGTGK